MNPTDALIICADISRKADPQRKSCHVCFERDGDKTATLAATDGHTGVRFDFPLADYPRSWIASISLEGFTISGHSFPKFSEARWDARLDGDTLRLERHTKSGKLSTRQPEPINLSLGHGALVSLWPSLTKREDELEIDISDNFLAEAFGLLDLDGRVSVCSDGRLKMTVGPWSFSRPGCPEFDSRLMSVSSTSEALAMHDANVMLISRTDTRAPISFRSAVHEALTMPFSKEA
jgi:hypothetical protein